MFPLKHPCLSIRIQMRSPQVSKQYDDNFLLQKPAGLPSGREQQQYSRSGPMPSAAVTAAGGCPLGLPSSFSRTYNHHAPPLSPITSPNSPRKARPIPKDRLPPSSNRAHYFSKDMSSRCPRWRETERKGEEQTPRTNRGDTTRTQDLSTHPDHETELRARPEQLRRLRRELGPCFKGTQDWFSSGLVRWQEWTQLPFKEFITLSSLKRASGQVGQAAPHRAGETPDGAGGKRNKGKTWAQASTMVFPGKSREGKVNHSGLARVWIISAASRPQGLTTVWLQPGPWVLLGPRHGRLAWKSSIKVLSKGSWLVGL